MSLVFNTPFSFEKNGSVYAAVESIQIKPY
jgi:hypothetical protein